MHGRYAKKEILSLLNEQGITYHYQTHGAVQTMDDVDSAGVIREGVVLKNLFLKDGKGKKHFLICVPETRHTDFKEIGEQIGAKKLGLASVWLKYGDMKKVIIQNGNTLHLLEFADKTD